MFLPNICAWGNLGPRESFPMMQCLSNQTLCKTLNALQWLIGKTYLIVWDTLRDYGRVEWQLILTNLEKPGTLLVKMLRMNLIRCVCVWGGGKVLLWHVASYWSHGRPSPIWALFLDVPLVCAGSPQVVVFGCFLANVVVVDYFFLFSSNLCQKQKITLYPLRVVKSWLETQLRLMVDECRYVLWFYFWGMNKDNTALMTTTTTTTSTMFLLNYNTKCRWQ